MQSSKPSISSSSKSSSSSTSHHQKSLLLPNGKIDISQLENEIMQDISNDALYHAQDEMKKRAVHTSKDYDEFKNFVACSQLRPVQSKQMGQLFVQRRGVGVGVGVGGNDGGTATTNSTSSNKMYTSQLQSEKRMAMLINEVEKRRKEGHVHLNDSNNNSSTIDSNGTRNQNDECRIDSNNSNTFKSIDDILKLDQVKIGQHVDKMNKKKRSKVNNCIHMDVPKNAMELEREWKLYCHTPLDVLKYITLSKDEIDTNLRDVLKKKTTVDTDCLPTFQMPLELRIEPEIIPKSICKIEINLDILNGVVNALVLLLSNRRSHEGEENDRTHDNELAILSFVNRWMVAMSQSGRFALNVEFLDGNQKENISLVLGLLETGIDDALLVQPNNERASEVQRGIGPLKTLYKVA